MFSIFDNILNSIKELRVSTDALAYSEGWKNLINRNVDENMVQINRGKSVLYGYDTYGTNTLKQQQILDYMGLPTGTSYEKFKNSLFGENYSQKNRESLEKYIDSLTEKDIKGTWGHLF